MRWKTKPKRVWTKYPHIPILVTMKPTPRVMLGKRLCWTFKEDGHCMTIYLDIKGEPHIASRYLADAKEDLVKLVKSTEEYEKIITLLNDKPHLMPYVEACRKGRSITGASEYERDKLIGFDIFDTVKGKFIPYKSVHELLYHHHIPIVKLFAETRHRSMKDLLKFRNYALKHCKAINLEGMVIKTNPSRVSLPITKYVQAKVKIGIPIATIKKIARGEVVYPQIPENEVMGAIDKAWQELGTKDFKEVKIAMPLVAKYVRMECKNHYYKFPSKLFHYYLAYIERHLT